ncbi:hypothetical protein LIP_2290 [Limnochorda pilosa]|uniref:CopG family transcriptional regulator n=2 Tax=Limnochorda pilosa TaxID=1555112 RepID=A0A0K2SLY3_LIMPI|nr:hypothetical protein LIP_2290 [Limnochorda pilosa]
MSRRISVRMPDDQAERFLREQRLRRQRSSDLLRDLVEEALRMRECPGIVFLDAPTGRQATVAGTGLAVWEVVSLWRSLGSVGALLDRFPHLSERGVRDALAYAERFPDEIEAAIQENEALDETELRRRYPYLTGLEPEP